MPLTTGSVKSILSMLAPSLEVWYLPSLTNVICDLSKFNLSLNKLSKNSLAFSFAAISAACASAYSSHEVSPTLSDAEIS